MISKKRLKGVVDENLTAEVRHSANSSPESLGAATTALAEYDMRPAVSNILAGPDADGTGWTEAAPEDPLARFRAQYDALPKNNILAQDSTWETVQARLLQPENADKLKKVQTELQNGGRLYAVMENGSCEFMDDNSETPPMFVKDNETGTMQIIFKRNPEQMGAARAQIRAKTHQWASIEEMLQWAQENSFDVFEADTKDERRFGKLMKLAEAASSHTLLFVGKRGGPWMATALKDARCADFQPVDRRVFVDDPNPSLQARYLGLLRRLNI